MDNVVVSMQYRHRKGFTLIELLVVIAIIGLLSTLAVVALSSARQKARDAKRVSDIKQLQSALDLFATEKGGYPKEDAAVDVGTGTNPKVCLDDSGFKTSTCAAGPTVYMGNIPGNPTPGGITYTYKGTGTCSSTCTDYEVKVDLEGTTGDLKDGSTDANTVPNCTATASGITCL